MSLAGRSAVIDMWSYGTIGKTCMHLVTGRPSFKVQTAGVRWYAKAALFCPTPGSQFCIITSTLRVQTECYGYFECAQCRQHP